MENQENSGSKGPPSPLAPSDSLDNPNLNTSHPRGATSVSSSPSTPFAQSIRPLTSTGIFSPPSTLPPVTLPPHPPLSPITGDLSRLPPGDNSPAPPSGQSEILNQQLQLSSAEALLDQLATSPEVEWDNYSSSPTFKRNQRFWKSRPRLSSTDPAFLSDSPSDHSPGIRKIQLVSTECSDIDSISEISSSVTMTGPELTSRADQLSNLKYTLDQMRTKLSYKIRAFTEDDVDEEDLEEAKLKLQELDDLFCSTWCHINNVVQNFSAELESQGVQEL